MTARRLITAAAAWALVLAPAGCGNKAEKEKPAAETLGVNLVRNPSFEEWEGAVPVGWELQHFDGSGTRENRYGKSVDEKKSGNFSYFLRGLFDVDKWMVITQRHPVPPGYRVSFSAEMKSTGLKKNKGQFDRANVFVRFFDKSGKRVSDRYYADADTHFLSGTLDWRRYARRVDIPDNARYAEIGLINQMTGYIYFDDVELVLEEPVPWKELRTKYVDFYYLDGHPFPEGAVEKQTAFVEKCVRMLDIKVEDKITYYYYPSEQKFQEIIGVKKGHERALWRRKELHTTKTFDDHEIIHLLLSHHESPPFGLAEGAVFYILGSWEGGRDLHMMAKEFLLNKQLPPLYRLMKQREEMEAVGMSIAVPAWASFSIWLIEHYGIEKFMKLYVASDKIVDPGPFNVHFRDIYGKDFDVVDRDWRLWVLRYQPKR